MASPRRICVLGGTGFVGRLLVARLNDLGWQVRVPTRRRSRHRELLVLPGVELIEADVHDAVALNRLLDGCAAAVNLIGILNERGHDGRGFERAHGALAHQLIAACAAQRVPRLLHMSALNADANERHSHYLRTKGLAEDAVHAAPALAVTSFRPSVIFGREDSFFNRFARLLRLVPGVFPLACADARFAPIYVGDVVTAFAHALDDPRTHGKRYALCGPRSYSLRELVAYTAQVTGLWRRIVGLPDGLSRMQARVFEYLPGKPFSLDNYWSLQHDSVCAGPPAPELGIEPIAVEAMVPRYLGRNGGRNGGRSVSQRRRANAPR